MQPKIELTSAENQEEQSVRPAFSTAEADKAAKQAKSKPRGSNITPKSDLHVGRDWWHHNWTQAFKAYCAKHERRRQMSGEGNQ